MARHNVTFWGTPKSRTGTFHPSARRPTSRWAAPERRVIKNELARLVGRHGSDDLPRLTRELNRWLKTEPQLPLPKAKRQTSSPKPRPRPTRAEGPRSLTVKRATRAQVKELLDELPVERRRSMGATPLRPQDADQLASDVRQERQRSQRRARHAATAKTRPPQDVTAWPSAYREALTARLRAERQRYPSLTEGDLLVVANAFHRDHAPAGLPARVNFGQLRALLAA